MSFLENFHYQIIDVGQSGSSKPKLVFLHSLMGNGSHWRGVIRRLTGDWTVLIYDQRGHGHSFKPSSGFTPEDYAEDLRFILDELGWDRVFLVGHSLGGRNAFHFTYRYPERVERLVIEDIGPDSSQSNVHKIERLLGLVPTPFVDKSHARHFFQEEFLQHFEDGGRARALSRFLYSNIAIGSEGQANWRFSKEAVLQSVRQGRLTERWQEIEGLRVPSLLIRGEHSEELPLSIFDRMLSINSQWLKGYQVPGVGHWVHGEKLEEFTEVMEGFLLQDTDE